MKIPQSLIEALPEALLNILQDRRPADKVVEFFGKKNKLWGSRDRRFFAECIYEVIRHYRKLWVRCGFQRGEYLNLKENPKRQMQNIIFLYLSEQKPEVLTPPSWKIEPQDVKRTFAEEHSYPDWLDELGRQELGSRWETVAEALNEKAAVYLRTNLAKTTREQLQKSLLEEGIEALPVEGSDVALKLTARKNVFISKAFLSGSFEVQDFSSQRVAPLLNPLPGERILDACAGAGGKTLHLAGLMSDKGKIIALDINERKLEELRKRARRAGHSIIETRAIESTKTVKRLEDSFQAALVDAPCSGSGVIRRNPSSKWNLTRNDFEKLLVTQQEILKLNSRTLKAGGRMVYATCSVFPSENQKQVQTFLAHHPNWHLVSEETRFPGLHEGDGFYMALLKKNSG